MVTTPCSLISIIVTTFRAHEHLNCLCASILRSDFSGKIQIEVVLYGDGGGDNSKAAIEFWTNRIIGRQAYEHFTFVTFYNPINLGLVVALNNACAMATGHWLLIVNDDMVFPRQWVAQTVPLLDRGSVLSLNCMEPQIPGRTSARMFYVKTLSQDPTNFPFESLDNFQLNIPHKIEVGVNYPFFIERQLFIDTGGADERFSGPYHDPDLFLRLRELGVKMVRANHIVLYHFSGVSLRFNGTKHKQSLNWICKENLARLQFIEKWHAKPKARFGEIPKTRLPKNRGSFFERVTFLLLLSFEKSKAKWREWRHGSGSLR